MSSEVKTCPRCGVTGSVKELFGYRKRNAGLRPQSFCFECRSSKKRKTTDFMRIRTGPLEVSIDRAKGADMSVFSVRSGGTPVETVTVTLVQCTKCKTSKRRDTDFRFLNKQGRYHSHCRQCENAARKK